MTPQETAKKIHATGMFSPSTGPRRTWCGRYVYDDQVAILGTDREVNCVQCLNGRVAREHAKRWGKP